MELSASNSGAPTKKEKRKKDPLSSPCCSICWNWQGCGAVGYFVAFVYKAHKFIRGGGFHVSGKVWSVKSNLKEGVLGINERHIRYLRKGRETCGSFLRSSEQVSGNEDVESEWS